MGQPFSLNYITRDKSGQSSPEFRTLFSQEMIDRGILMPWVAVSLAHGDQELEMTLTAARQALDV